MVVQVRPESSVLTGEPRNYVEPSLIQPYILGRLIVKAKRMK